MSNALLTEPLALCGADVSATWIDAAAEAQGQRRTARFENNAAGHQAFCKWLTGRGQSARVVIEATGLYSLDLALALDYHPRIEVMVANPRTIHDFARASQQRSKTDRLDAATILEFARRMPFTAWRPPSAEVLELRSIARRVAALVVERTRERNRLKSLQASGQASRVVSNDILVNLNHLTRRITRLVEQAVALVKAHEPLRRAFDHLTSVRGIADKSAIQILPELLMLPEELTVKQWVAHAGLDPKQHQSGTSVEKPSRISKVGNVHLRRALYMPALVAIRREPHVQAFYEKLLARGKKPMQANVAVMRKLLHAIYGMLKTDSDFDGAKFMQMTAAAA